MIRRNKPKRSIMSEQQAFSILQPYLSIIEECISNAWAKWLEFEALLPSHSYQLKARSRATIVNDYMCQEARARFLKARGVTVTEINGILVLDFQHEIFLRFKKLDETLRHSNIPTIQQRFFDNETYQPEFPNMPDPAVTLVAGYQLNKLQTAIKGMFITCPLGKSVTWNIPLTGTTATNVTNIANNQQPATAKKSRIKAKNKTQEAKEKGS